MTVQLKNVTLQILMSEPGFPDFGEGDETLAKFPQLARGRNLYIALFKDDSPLVNLGYTASQKRLAKEVLHLVGGPGKIWHPDKPALTQLVFMEGSKWVAMKEIPGEIGYEMQAVNEPSFSHTPVGLIAQVLRSQENPVFEMDYVSFVNLVKENTIETNLDSLIKSFYSSRFFYSKRIEKESPLSRVSRALGITATYRGKWVDENTKLEFAVEVKSSADKEIGGPFYQTWRRLNPISDLKGKVIPFGRKPDSSKNKVLDMLNRESRGAIQGRLAWQPQ
jgi:hypothetical protein